MIEIFSNWIFVWFVLFYVGIIKANPLLFLCIGYAITVLEIFYLIVNKTNSYNIKKFLIINVILKFVPILILITTTKINIKNFNYDFIFGLFVLFSYIITTTVFFNINIINTYKNIFNSYINDDKEKRSHVSRFYDYIYERIKRY